MKRPFMLGSYLTGEVVAVGSVITRFKPGDRVFAYAVGTEKEHNRSAERAFLAYTVVLDSILDSLSFESAAVLPMAIVQLILRILGEPFWFNTMVLFKQTTKMT